MATNIELQAQIKELEARLEQSQSGSQDERVAALEARLAEAKNNSAARVADLEAQLARQSEQDAARADTKMVRLKSADTGSVVYVDEGTAATLGTGWSKVK